MANYELAINLTDNPVSSRRFPRRSMSPKCGLPGLCDCGIANRPFPSDRDCVARSSVTRMDFDEQMQNVPSTVGRLTYQQAMYPDRDGRHDEW